eukprot:1397951-Pleurochrysis_carterae.AAC.7
MVRLLPVVAVELLDEAAPAALVQRAEQPRTVDEDHHAHRRQRRRADKSPRQLAPTFTRWYPLLSARGQALGLSKKRARGCGPLSQATARSRQ